MKAAPAEGLADCLRDMMTLLALPPIWSGRSRDEILELSLEALATVVRFEVGYIELPPRAHERSHAAAWVDGRLLRSGAEFERVRDALTVPGQLEQVGPRPVLLPGHPAAMRANTVPLGFYSATGHLVVAAARPDFPSSHQAVLLKTGGGLVTSALDAARMLEEAHAAQARISAISEASEQLFEAPEAGLRAVPSLVIPRLADFCALEVVERGDERDRGDEHDRDGGTRPRLATSLALAHRDPKLTQVAQGLRARARPEAPWPGFDPARMERLLWQRTDPASAPARALLESLALENLALFPLVVGGECMGALVLGSAGRMGQDVLRGGEELARRVALALDNLRLDRAARQAKRRKDEFLAILGHELRNPLAPIITALGLMELRDQAAFPRERALITRQTQHMIRLVDDLLDLSRLESGKVELQRERVELHELLERGLELARPLIDQRGHRCELLAPRTGLPVLGDVARLTQVVANLLQNAAKYTDERGHISVRASRTAGRVSFSVRDNGTGISPELLPHVFGAFTQEGRTFDRAQGGLGLGLAIVRNVVQLHAGRVSATSAGVGFGAEFVVELPLAVAPPVRPQEKVSPLPATLAPPARPLRVLVVDDNVDAAEALAEVIAFGGHQTRVAHDGPSGLREAEAFAPQLAFLDLGLPGMDGFELARRVRALPGRPVPMVVALSGYGQAQDRERSASAGFDRHLVKPAAIDAIDALLAEVAVGLTPPG